LIKGLDFRWEASRMVDFVWSTTCCSDFNLRLKLLLDLLSWEDNSVIPRLVKSKDSSIILYINGGSYHTLLSPGPSEECWCTSATLGLDNKRKFSSQETLN
jgi:hypothetical protein